MIKQARNGVMSRLRWGKIAIIAILMGLLAGCPVQSTKVLSYDETRGSAYYLSQANSSSGSSKVDWQLLTVRAFLAEGNVARASQYFSQISSDLSKEQQKEYTLLKGEIAVKSNQPFDLRSLNITMLNNDQKIRYYQIKIGTDKYNNDVNAAMRDYIELEKYGTEAQRHEAINDTWKYLVSLNENAINSVLVYANEPVLQGWIDLIYTYHNNNNVYTIEETDDAETISQKEEAQYNLLSRAVEEWRMQYSTHPAAIYLPRTIYGEKHLLSDSVDGKNIALFLPLSGSSKVFGDAIQLGYLDASKYYPNEARQNIQIYDTTSAPLDELLKQAEKQNMDLIVGPLLKNSVKEIQRLNPSLPVLALNKLDNDDPAYAMNAKICYFGLAPEDEAMDAAQHIYSQNKRRPLLIVPQNNLGKRVADSFAQQWKGNAAVGEVYIQYFDSAASLSKKMNAGQGIELEGEIFNNYVQVPGMIAEQPFSSSTHQLTGNSAILEEGDDIIATTMPASSKSGEFDAIYVYATNEELSLIKSMLEMKSNRTTKDAKGNQVAIKKNIPAIYTSSRSNTASVTQDYRYDMERVQFSEIPLIVDKNNLLETLPSYISNDYSLVRLYAMGIDAWRLANHFGNLQPHQIDLLDGMTGKLSVGQQCEITRTLPWKQYRNGQEVVLP